MKWPQINEDRCQQAAKACTDARCSDPVFAAQNPEICRGGGQGQLVIKPEFITECAPTEVTFAAFMRTPAGDVEVEDGVVWSSSDVSVLSIDGTSGQATALASGVATVSAEWQGMTAHAQANVLGTDGTCCDSVQVLIAAGLDNSLSMGQAYDGGYSSKLAVGKAVLQATLGQLLEKDLAGVLLFNDTVAIEQDLTNDVAALSAAVESVPQSKGNTNLALAFDSLLAMVSVSPDGLVINKHSSMAITNIVVSPSPIPTSSSSSGRLHGLGPPASTLGNAGDTYVDDISKAFYWKTLTGWQP